MADSSLPSGSADSKLAELANSLAAGRTRAQQALAAQRARMREMEQLLAQQVADVTAELEQDRAAVQSQQENLQAHAGALQEQQSQLLADQAEWERLQEESTVQQQALAEFLQHKQDELDCRESALEAEEAQLLQVQRTLEESQRDLDSQMEQLSHVRKRVDEKLATLEQDREAVDTLAQETKIQRRHIARQMQEQRNRLQRELDQQREALERERAALASQNQGADRQVEKLAEELAGVRTELKAAQLRSTQLEIELAAAEEKSAAEVQESQQSHQKKIAELERKFSVAADEARTLRRLHGELEEQLAQRPASNDAKESAQVARLTEERDALQQRLADAESKAKKSLAPSDLQQKMQELQRRFEMAVEDVRELKTENAELEKQVKAARASASAGKPADSHGGNLDWEARKRALLASLEEDFDEDDEESRRERLSIEGTIQITDEVIAEKEREILGLQQLLEEQSSQVGGMAVGAAAIAATLDVDELIREERRRLGELQTELQAKLRQAEIDISLERATMARERMALEEQSQELQARLQEIEKTHPTPAGKLAEEKAKKSPGGRWLARLGLKETGEEKG